MTADEVVKEITRRAWSFGVPCLLSPSSSVSGADGVNCSGYFDTKPLLLACSTGIVEQTWLGILLHEYCHLTQWAENCKAWQALDASPGMWGWLDGKPIKNAIGAVEITQEVEADCERRTVRLIREIGAPIDVEEYCRQANSYIHFHNVIKAHRKWTKAPGALNHPEILKHCNTALDTRYEKTPKNLYDALVKYAI